MVKSAPMASTNHDTVWDPTLLPKPSSDPAQIRADIDIFGYGVIQNALDSRILKSVQDRLIEQAECERSVYRHQNPANPIPQAQWVNMLLNKGDIFFELTRHPLAMSMIEYILGSDYQISCVDSQIQHPGAGTMPMHTDQWWLPPLHHPNEAHRRASNIQRDQGVSCNPMSATTPISPPVMANVMWMITPFSEQTGATRVVPGSHLSGVAPDSTVPHKVPSVPAEGPPGTAVVFDGRLWHSAWSNESSESRYGITTACCGPQCRPIENYTRGMRPDVLERCPADILNRLGFGVWSSYGHIGDLDAQPYENGTTALGPLYR